MATLSAWAPWAADAPSSHANIGPEICAMLGSSAAGVAALDAPETACAGATREREVGWP